MKYSIILILLSWVSKISYAQNSLYSGGEEDGYASTAILSASTIYGGGEGSGYAGSILNGSSVIYEGGSDDGYDISILVGDPEIYSGGGDDGYSSFNLNGQPVIYPGGKDDGYAITNFQGTQPYIYEGGSDDGYEMVSLFVPFTWTGAVGTGWNVPENWNSNVVPTHNRPTIIPAGVPNYPSVNAGLFSIGKKYHQADFYSGELLVRPGAELLTRINCEVFLHGYAQISGLWYVRNLTPGSFFNQGELEVRGSVIFVED